MLDDVDEALDRRLAQHLVSLYLEDIPETGGGQDILVRPVNSASPLISVIPTTFFLSFFRRQPFDQLAAYITYARSRLSPAITEAAGSELVKSYVTLRKAGDDPRTAEKRITATTRQLESMIRLSEAHARMRFSSFVELEDVKEAYRLMREAINTSARDPTTGEIDMGLLDTGMGRAQRKMRGDLRKEILALVDGGEKRGVRWGEALKALEEQSSVRVTTAEFHEVVKELEQEGLVKTVGDRERRMIRRVEGA